MGASCALCSDLKIGSDRGSLSAGFRAAASLDEESSEEESGSGEDIESQVAASSDEEVDNTQSFKQDVEAILQSTTKDLRRGKTMAIQEAISTAKKVGVDDSKISEAEEKLQIHKKEQRRQEVLEQVEAFFSAPDAGDAHACHHMAKKAQEADCPAEVVKRLQDRAEELTLCRPLEEDEAECIRSYLRQNCIDFVASATGSRGRGCVLVELDRGHNVKGSLSVNPSLERLHWMPSGKEEVDVSANNGASSSTADGGVGEEGVPIDSLVAVPANVDKKVSGSPGYRKLDAGDSACVLVLRYEFDSKPGAWCVLEPTPQKRDQFIEAITWLARAVRTSRKR